jgi:hypothetical protein
LSINTQLAAQYVASLPESKRWFDTAKEDTVAGVDRTGIRGIDTSEDGARPLAAFNTWASGALGVFRQPGFDTAAFATRAGFDAVHLDFVRSLEAYWPKHGFVPLNRPQALRLVNLFIKQLRVKAKSRPTILNSVRENGHIVVNTPNLAKLRDLLGTGLPAYEPSMDESSAMQSYQVIQQEVRDFCAVYGGSPLMLDIFFRS